MREIPKKTKLVKNADELQQPGDYYFVGPNDWTPVRTVIMACAFCGMPSAHSRNRIESLPKEPLTMTPELQCAYAPSHRFTITEDEIKVLK